LRALWCLLISRPRAATPLPYTTLFRSSETYTFGSYQGASLFDFEPAQAGAYRLSCEVTGGASSQGVVAIGQGLDFGSLIFGVLGDRKSTRLNSSHVKISYAVFCLKTKT